MAYIFDRFLHTSNTFLQLFQDVFHSAENDYRINLTGKQQLFTNDSIAYNKGVHDYLLLIMIDKEIYTQIQPAISQITSFSELRAGLILMNYPTTILSIEPNSTLLNKDEIFLITNVTELGIQGYVLNPYNIESSNDRIERMQEFRLRP